MTEVTKLCKFLKDQECHELLEFSLKYGTTNF